MSLKNDYRQFEEMFLKGAKFILDSPEKRSMLDKLAILEASILECERELKEHRDYDSQCFP